MRTVFSMILCMANLMFPSFMLTFAYPVNKKLSMFWANYVSSRCTRIIFAVFKMCLKYRFLCDRKQIDNLPEQFILVSNHQSLLDIVCFFNYFRNRKMIRFVAKDSLIRVPLVGKMLLTQKHCFIPRKGSPSVSMKAIEKFGHNVMRYGHCPLIFPEGTRSRTGNVGTFYSAGLRRLCEITRLPVVCFAIDGGYKVSTLDEIMTQMKYGSYRIKVLKVFDPPLNKESQLKVLEESRQLISDQVDYWHTLPVESNEL